MGAPDPVRLASAPHERRPSSGSAGTCGSATSRPFSRRPRRPGPVWRCSSSTRRCSARPAPPGGRSSTAALRASTRRSVDGCCRTGRPGDVVPRVAAAVDAATVHVAADFGPYGARRDAAVEQALDDGRELSARARRTPWPQAGCARTTASRTGSSPRSAGRGPSTAGARRPTTDASTVDWLDPGDKRGGPRAVRHPRRRARRRRAARRGRAAAHASGGRRSSTMRVAPTATTATAPTGRGPRGMSVYLKYGRCTRARCWPTWPPGGRRRQRPTARELAWREFYADVLLPPARLGPGELRQAVRRAARGAGRTPPRAVRRVARGPHRLPDRRRRDAPAARAGVDAQPGPHDRRQLPGQGPAPAVVVGRAALHAACWSTATWPPTSTAGSGRRAAGPTRRRTSGCSTRSPRARSSTPRATTCAGSCPSCAACPARRCTSRGRCPAGPGRLPGADRRPPGGAAEALDRYERVKAARR